MSEMVERVARAMALLEWPYATPQEQKDWADTHWQKHIPYARAAIAAMREPTQRMEDAVHGAGWLDDMNPRIVWQYMTDAALMHDSDPHPTNWGPHRSLWTSNPLNAVAWRRVNDEPFEYAIQQGPHGDEFVKLNNGGRLRRPLPVLMDPTDP